MKNRILIIDKNDTSRDTLSRMLSNEYVIEKAVEPDEAISILKRDEEEIVAVIVDMLGKTDMGFDFLEAVSKESVKGVIPVIVMCNPTSVEMEERLFSYGIAECISQPFSEKLIRLKVNNIVKLYIYQNELEDKVKQQTKQLELQYTILKKEAEFLQQSNVQIIDLLGMMAEYRNQESGEHIQRIKRYTQILADEYMKEFPEKGLTREKINVIVSTSPLHDIGKIAITDTILLKPGKLTDREFDYMKSHTLNGCEILEKLKDAWSTEYAKTSMDICKYHHERYDGSGYPEGLKGESIPLSAQIVSVADVYDALVHERVYKAAIPKNRAYEMITNGECGMFSPDLLQCLANCREQMEAV